MVQLEALASGVPVAAIPGDRAQGRHRHQSDRGFERGSRSRLHGRLQFPREACRAFALGYSWENSARQFIGHVRKVATGGVERRNGDAGDGNRSRLRTASFQAHAGKCAGRKQEDHDMTSISPARTRQGDDRKAYARWAPVYDLVFGAVFEHGRDAAIAAAERIGGRILEVGVGTGLVAAVLLGGCPALRRRYFRADAAQGAGAGQPNSA